MTAKEIHFSVKHEPFEADEIHQMRWSTDPGGALFGQIPFWDASECTLYVPPMANQAEPMAQVTGQPMPGALGMPTAEIMPVPFVRVMQSRIFNGRRVCWFDIRPAHEVNQ